jgi:hypothetical protein
MMVGLNETRHWLRNSLRTPIGGVSLRIFCTYSVALDRGCDLLSLKIIEIEISINN